MAAFEDIDLLLLDPEEAVRSFIVGIGGDGEESLFVKPEYGADPLCWHPKLLLNHSDFIFENERLMYVPSCGVPIHLEDQAGFTIPVVIRPDCPGKQRSQYAVEEVQLRTSGNGNEITGYCAFLVRENINAAEEVGREECLLVYRFVGEERVQTLLDIARKTLCCMEGGRIQLYRTPADVNVKQDKWWNKKYPNKTAKSKKNDAEKGPGDANEVLVGGGDDPYSAYRSTIDRLIEDRVDSLIRNKKLGGSSCPDGICVAELCGGDGSLAEKLVRFLRPAGLQKFIMLERNKALLAVATKRLGEFGELTQVHQVDTARLEGQELMGSLEPRPHLWVASGSTLCGQVGSPGMAEPTLERMAQVLLPGGFMVITGFTTSFLTPATLHRAGLTVLRGSLPSCLADGLETDCGLFHMWVLQKPLVEPTESTATTEAAHEIEKAGVRR
mmetsp:Transcript_34644/g.78319  ORF Transcript_34644/g.78319 Transcript_34644/m.78319 type:complete len:442 (-) Transcript_34644:156-1481(-)